MIRPLFFSDATFAWVFCVVLVALTGIAAWTDTRKAKIPNRLTVLILVLGLIGNAVRGGILSANAMPVWWLTDQNPGTVWIGVVDGLLFALTGFLVAFVAMFVVWTLGVCGGGDVKLFGAVAAWVGYAYFPLVWLASVVVLFVWTLAKLFAGGLTPKKIQKSMAALKQPAADREANRPAAGKPGGKLRVTYSLPIAVATAVVLMWVFRVELQLAQPKPQPAQPPGASAHDRPAPLAA